MKLDRRFKEAFKVALAFALVYGIALKMAWLNPSWAGFGVAMIAMQTAGQSIHKGLDRLAGTIPGCIAALVILALAPLSFTPTDISMLHLDELESQSIFILREAQKRNAQ